MYGNAAPMRLYNLEDITTIAESKKNNALNSLHSIIFTLPEDKLFVEKFDQKPHNVSVNVRVF